MRYVNEELLPKLSMSAKLTQQRISESGAKWWLWKLGYWCTEMRKGMYIDGHERDDVVKYRKEYLKFFSNKEGIGRCVMEIPGCLPDDHHLTDHDQADTGI
jgi:hypothetical protein